MSLTALSALVLAAPIIGAVGLAVLGRRLPARTAGAVAAALLGTSFMASVALGARALPAARALTDDGSGGAIIVKLWSWFAAGEDMVELTVAARALEPDVPISSDAVGRGWVSAHVPGLGDSLAKMWDAQAVVGQSPDVAVPAGEIVTSSNVPPVDGEATLARPRREYRFEADMSLLVDGLSLFLTWLVTGLAFLLQVCAVAWAADDPAGGRSSAVACLLVFGVLLVVLGANMLVMLVGWQLVTLTIYLLVGIGCTDRARAGSALKGFVTSLFGDIALLVGMMLVWSVFGSLAYSEIGPSAAERLATDHALASGMALLLVVAMVCKGAQVALHAWRRDTSASTPAVALVCTLTPVAGVFVGARLLPLLGAAPRILGLVAAAGCASAVLASVFALAQRDTMRMLTYVIAGQVGFAFLGLGVGAAVGGVFHLATLAAGVALTSGAGLALQRAPARGQDGSRRGEPSHSRWVRGPGLGPIGVMISQQPLAGWGFVAGSMSLAGLVPLAGFWSRDEILEAVAVRAITPVTAPRIGLWLAALATVLLTAVCVGRLALVFATIWARSERTGQSEAPSLPFTVRAPVAALIAAVLIGGLAGVGSRPLVERLLLPALGGYGIAQALGPPVSAWIATALTVSGLAIAWLTDGPHPNLDLARVTARWVGLGRRLAGGGGNG